jgi:hypothetical protein
MSREDRNHEQSIARAVVINASLAWSMLVGFLALGVFLVVLGWNASQKMRDISDINNLQSARLTTIESTITARRADRDKQFDAVGDAMKAEALARNAADQAEALARSTADQAQEQRLRPLEVTTSATASSLAFIRDQITSGFSEIGRRLDRIEGKADRTEEKP